LGLCGGRGAWSAAGNSAPQIAQGFVDDGAEQVTLEAGFLWHKLTRASPRLGLRAEITNFAAGRRASRVDAGHVDQHR
jgi:dihydrodipicolinate synthase/N-acetylneuraminate lyase